MNNPPSDIKIHSAHSSWANRVGFGSGHAMISAKNMLFHFFFLFYFTNVMGVPEWQVMAATLVAILIDAITDPAMGQISDATRSTRWGRRHGWILLGSVPTAITLALLFSPPGGLGATGVFLWMFAFMILTRLAVTVYTVPYFALSAELSPDYQERTVISAVRAVFENIWNLLVFILGFLIFLPDREGLEDGMLYEAGYGPFALTMGIVGIIGAIILVWTTRDKIPATQPLSDEPTQPWYSAFPAIARAFKVPEFRNATIGYSILVTLYGTISQLSLFVGAYLWRFDQIQKLIASIIPFLVIVPAAIFAGWLAKQTDKRKAALYLTWLFGLSFSVPFVFYLLGLTPEVGSGALLLFVGIAQGLGYAGFVGTIILSFSMLADVTDLMTLKTAKKQEALLFSGFTFANKLAFAGGLIFATFGLLIIDLPDGALPSEVGDGITDSLALYSIVINIVLMLGAWWIYRRYTLTRERHNTIREQLALQK